MNYWTSVVLPLLALATGGGGGFAVIRWGSRQARARTVLDEQKFYEGVIDMARKELNISKDDVEDLRRQVNELRVENEDLREEVNLLKSDKERLLVENRNKAGQINYLEGENRRAKIRLTKLEAALTTAGVALPPHDEGQMQAVTDEHGELIRFEGEDPRVDRRVWLFVKSPEGVPMIAIQQPSMPGVQITEAEFMAMAQEIKAKATLKGLSYTEYIQKLLNESESR